ncbi:agamous-like MADS-box protein AGL9-like protein isoform X2 [Iris pallida]|uniref:Agamous-like MADS-box protein AGL9-like protein isoform X2 n=1 Tax=Iris pallida TaxID=29817 RepID=A0AAX6EM70_IRIPA|nr:agamous-like MADS-box protein AGL9-like protein isoform X2 [Iris pallida]
MCGIKSHAMVLAASSDDHTKTQYMLDQLADLQRKEQMLCEANRSLRKRLEESTQASHQQVWESNADAIGYNRQANQQGEEFYHPLDCQPTLQIGNNGYLSIIFAIPVMSSSPTMLLAWRK